MNLEFSWSLSPKQTDIFHLDNRFRVAMCGRRFGKNEVATAILTDFALRPDSYDYGADDNPVCWWVGPTYTQTQKYGFEKVLEKLPDSVIDGQAKRSAPFEIPLINGAQMEFYSFDRPSSLQGAGVDMMVIDEAAYMPETIWDNDLRPMLLDNNGGALLISKPMGENWFSDRFNMGMDDSEDDWGAVHATSYDNPFIDNEEIDAAMRTTPEQIFRQEYLADPQAGGALLTLDMLEYEPAETLNNQEWYFHIGVDLGIEMNKPKARENDTDYWALAIVAEHPERAQAYVTEVHRRRGQTPAQAADWILGHIGGYPTNEVRFEAVQAQAWFETDLQDAGLHPIPIKPTGKKEDRILNLSVPFNNRAVKLIDWGDVDGKEVSWKQFRNEWAAFPGDHDDQLDAVAMALDPVNFGIEYFAEGTDMYDR